MQLHPHQAHALDIISVAHSRISSSVLVQQPCGTGKTEIGVRAAVSWVHQRGVRHVVVAVPTLEIQGQWVRRLAQLTRLPVRASFAGRGFAQPRIVVLTYAALWQFENGLPCHDALLIFDEAHHGNYEAPSNLRLVRAHPHVLGLSATPWTAGCVALFGATAQVSLPLSVAIRQQLVSTYQVLPWEAPRGPYGLVFVSGVATAQETARALGCRASWAAHTEPRSRARINSWLRGTLPVLVVDRMVSEGCDCPRCAAVWFEREPESDVLLVQCAGRAFRYQAGKTARLHCRSGDTADRLQSALQRCDTPRLTAF